MENTLICISMVAEWVTTNIAKLLDLKLAAILKLVTELSEKFDTILERVGMVEQQVSDLEDTSGLPGDHIQKSPGPAGHFLRIKIKASNRTWESLHWKMV